MYRSVETKITITFVCITNKCQRVVSIVFSLTKFAYKTLYRFYEHCLAI